MADNKIILGIDPGTQIMGFGVIELKSGKPYYVTMGSKDFRKIADHYERIGEIFHFVEQLISQYKPTDLAIEAPFYGKNVQSMLKLGRAQGVAIAAAIRKGIPIHEYAPLKIKMALTGKGSASKEQVSGMLQRILNLKTDEMPKYMDATDALAAAYCHFLQMNNPNSEVKHIRSWKEFAIKNKKRISNATTKKDCGIKLQSDDDITE